MKKLIPPVIALAGLALAVPSATAESAGSAVDVEFARRGGNPIPLVRHEPVTYYIAENGDDANDGSAERPLATLQRAVELTRLVERDCERRIVFRDGYYSFDRRVNLNSADWDLVITAEHPGGAVLSGSVPVTDWQDDPDLPGVWVADFPMDEAPENIQYAFICNGEKRTVATMPSTTGNYSFEPNGSKRNLVYDPDDLSGVAFDRIDLSSAWVMVYQEWTSKLIRIATNDVANHAFWLKSDMGFKAGSYDDEGFQLCNTRDGLGRAGAWMFSCAEHKIRYRPMSGETKSNVSTHLTDLSCLLYANNTPGLVISNLVFEGCARDYNFTGGYTLPHSAPISIYHSTDVVIDNVEVRNCACVGIAMTKPTRMTIRNSHIHDVGSTAVCFYDGGNGWAVVEGNEIHDFGQTGSGSGVTLSVSNAKLLRNKIYNGARTAITMWGDNLVCASNEMFAVMKSSEDGGALYGAYNDSLVCDNVVYDIYDYGKTVFGLYCDEGGQRNLITRNRVTGLRFPVHNHATQFNVVSNNTFKLLDGRAMYCSFQGSGHGIFCDNKLYQTTSELITTYYGNCDFWGRNELFVNGVSQGISTVDLPRPSVGSFYARNITNKKDASGNPLVPIDGEGNVNWSAFDLAWNEAQSMVAGENGGYVKGVPSGSLYAAYDATYLYLGVRRFYNALKNYTGCKNVKNGGWRHCDAWRIVFGTKSGWTEVRTIDLYPEAYGGCVADASFEIKTNDVGYVTISGNPASLVRVRRDKIGVAAGVSGRVNFNAMIWSEDLREMRMLYPAKSDTDPSGEIKVQ